MELPFAPLGYVRRHGLDGPDQLLHIGLVLGSGLVDDLASALPRDRHGFAPLARANLRDAVTDHLCVVVVLEGRLDGEGLGGWVLDVGPLDVERSQVASKGDGAGADDRVEGQSELVFQIVKT